MTTRSRGRAAPAVALLGVLALVVACSDADERARTHIEKGAAYVAESKFAEARLEFQNALRFDPQSVEANNQMAAIEFEVGNYVAALARMNEAYRLDPTDSEASLHLASMLQADRPDRAEALVEAVIEREPDNVAGYIGRSDFALGQGRMRAAGVAARKAMEVAPKDPRADWQFGYVLQAMIREGQLTGEPVEDSVYESALAAFERYIAKGGPAPWNAQVEEARIMAAWKGNTPEAAAQFRIALDHSLKDGRHRDQRQAAARTAAFARSTRNHDLREYALEVLVELEPRDYASWRKLADLRKRGRKDPEPTWQQLLTLRPDDPRAHIEYARFLISQWKLDEALAYLAMKADAGVDPPMLRGAIASTQIAARRIEDADRTIVRLEQDHPGHSRTIQGRAQLDIRQGRIRKATRDLRQLAEQQPDADAYLLLARAEMISGNSDAALAAVDKAIEARPVFAYEEHRLRARLQTGKGEYRDAIKSLDAIRDRMSLSNDDQVLLARCYYENGQPRHGRELLEELLAERRPPAEAVLEYTRREDSSVEGAEIARRALDDLLRREPRNWEALREVTRLDLAADRKTQALERVDRIVARTRHETSAQVRLLRAKVSAEAGREEGTIADSRAAFEAEPRLRGALEFLVALHLRKGELDAALAAVEEADRAKAMDPSRRLLLGRLYQMKGRDADAVETFERALVADQTNPSLYYHMAMALQALDRSEEATQALEKALSLGSSFPEANDAKRALEGTRSAGAS